MFEVFLGGDEGRLREFLIEAGDLDLLPVFRHLLKIVGGSEIGEFLLQFLFQLNGDLVGTFSNDAYCLVYISGLLRHGDHVACHGSERCVCLLVVHNMQL